MTIPRLEPLRFAFISVHTSPIAPLGGNKTGGMNVYIHEVAREMGRRGILVDIFTRAETPEQLGQIVEYAPNARVIYLPCGEPKPVEATSLFLHLNEFRDALINFAAELHYDAIYSHYWLSGWVSIQLRNKWTVPVAQMFHTLGQMKNRITLNPNMIPSDDIRVRGELEVIRHVDRVIAATPAERSQLLLLYRADRRKIDIVPPGVDLKRFQPGNREIAQQKLDWKSPQFLFVGRIEPLKGIDNILEALAVLRERDDLPHFGLTIVGGDPLNGDEEMQRLQMLTQLLELQPYVHFAGAQGQESLPDFYRAAEALVMPSDYESFGMVALEAMASGTPVLASEVGGLAFLIEHQKTGYHIPLREPKVLAQFMAELLSDPQKRAEMGEAAAQAAQNYSWSRIVDELLQVFTMLGIRPKPYSVH